MNTSYHHCLTPQVKLWAEQGPSWGMISNAKDLKQELDIDRQSESQLSHIMNDRRPGHLGTLYNSDILPLNCGIPCFPVYKPHYLFIKDPDAHKTLVHLQWFPA